MTYEESFKYLHAVIEEYLNEEDTTSIFVEKRGTIYDDSSVLLALLYHVYSNLYLKESRDKLDRILIRPQSESVLKRIRIKQLQVVALTGAEFVEKLEENLVDEIYRTSLSNTSIKPTPRKELARYVKLRPFIWFCAVASTIYVPKYLKYKVEQEKKSKSEKKQSARTISAAEL